MEMDNFWRRIKGHFSDPLDVELYRVVMEECGALATEPTDVTYEEVQCPGTVRPAIWCKPKAASPTKLILYLHGGAFIAGSPRSHRKLTAHLAKRANTYALLIDYRQAPEHQFPAQIEDAVETYKWLLHENHFSSSNIAFAGDSAGGNMTFAVPLALKQQGLPLPAVLAAFSPWLDMRVSGESYVTNNNKDALVVADALSGAVLAYIGNASLDDPLIDLLRTDLTGLPPIYITTGMSEILESDAVTLAKNAREAGIDVQLELAKDMQHIWVALAGNAPEADKTLDQAAKFISSKLNK